MAEPSVTPDYRTREVTVARLLELRPTLEAEGVRHVFLFGSVARGDDVPEFDVDVMLDLDPEHRIGLFQFADIALLLEERLGRHVDVLSHANKRPNHRGSIGDDLYEVF